MKNSQTEFRDYLVRLAVEQWSEGENPINEVVLRVAGVDESTAVSGVKSGLNSLDGIESIQVKEVWRDHD